MKTQCLKMLALWGALGLAASLPAFPQTSEQGPKTNDAVVCRESPPIPVALVPGEPASWTVRGELCATEDELSPGSTIQLLIPGATYNRDYWDFGKIDGITYSYARDAAAQGMPTFALDLPGAGESSHPVSSQVTAQAAAFAVHQIVEALRNGSIEGVQFGKVIIVGHSLGSVVVWEEAINYADVDGVIVTGAAHSIKTKFLTANALYPAINDPKFANSGLDSGYLTTLPGSRGTLFYSAPDFNPAVLAADEKRKDVVPAAELNTGLPIVTSKDTLAIHVPVLTILGSNDFTTCGANPQGDTFDCSSGSVIAKEDAPFYSPEARFHACVIPGSGHDVNFAVNHRLAVADTVAWSFAFVAQRRLADTTNLNQGDKGLPWNDGLPWNCGGISSQPE